MRLPLRELPRWTGGGRRALRCGLFGCLTALLLSTSAAEKPNILFIIGDDMRPQLAAYGFPQMKTPHLDQLAKEGVTFTRAYVQQGICSPSRASFLTGCYPDTTGVNFPYTTWFTDVFVKKHPTLMRFYTDRGWHTKTYQKVHHGVYEEGLSEPKMMGKYELWDVPYSPSTRPYAEAPPEYRNSYSDESFRHLQESAARGAPLNINEVRKKYMPPWGRGTTPDGSSAEDTGFVAGQNVEDALEVMSRASREDTPFFLALGMANTHYPFISPAKYWDLYSEEDLEFAVQDTLADKVYRGQLHSDARSKYAGWQKRGQETLEYKRNLLHGYYAAVSYQDALMGKLFDHLKQIGEWDNTIVCVIGDHGYHLGEQSHWGKYSCFEVGLRTPLIWKPQASVPFQAGARSEQLVEFVDLYPTFNELTGHRPADAIEGLSMVPLLENPERPWKQAAFSQKVLFSCWLEGKQLLEEDGSTMRGEGYSVRKGRYRYTEFRADSRPRVGARNGRLLGRQLFDLEQDPHETVNLAGDPDHAETVQTLSRLLQDREAWKQTWPDGYRSLADNPPGVDDIYYTGDPNAPFTQAPKVIRP